MLSEPRISKMGSSVGVLSCAEPKISTHQEKKSISTVIQTVVRTTPSVTPTKLSSAPPPQNHSKRSISFSPVVESGLLPRYAPTHFAIIFERDPIWILGLHSSFVASVCFYSASEHQNHHLLRESRNASDLQKQLAKSPAFTSLFTNALRQLGLHHIKYMEFQQGVDVADLILISGSVTFYNHLIDI